MYISVQVNYRVTTHIGVHVSADKTMTGSTQP